MKKDITKKINERLRLSQLIARKQIGIISPKEEQELARIIEGNDHLSNLYEQLLRQTEVLNTINNNTLTEKEVNIHWKQFQRKHLKATAKQQRSSMQRLRLMYIGAATIAAMICGFFFLIHPIQIEEKIQTAYYKPYKSIKYTNYTSYTPITYHPICNNLTMEDCQVHYSLINLNASNLTISKVITQNGNHINFMIPDSSKIDLNQCSTLRYPTNFNNKVREVWLDGEAYFNVKHEENRRFLVHAGNITISVLGTQFNVHAYPGAPTKVTLISGSIKIKTPKDSQLLQPGETAIYDNDKLSICEESSKEATAWTNDRFYFNYRTMEELSILLSKWYGIHLTCKNKETEQAIVFLDTTRLFSIIYAVQHIETLNNDQVICFRIIDKTNMTAYVVDKKSYSQQKSPPN